MSAICSYGAGKLGLYVLLWCAVTRGWDYETTGKIYCGGGEKARQRRKKKISGAKTMKIKGVPRLGAHPPSHPPPRKKIELGDDGGTKVKKSGRFISRVENICLVAAKSKKTGVCWYHRMC